MAKGLRKVGFQEYDNWAFNHDVHDYYNDKPDNWLWSWEWSRCIGIKFDTKFSRLLVLELGSNKAWWRRSGWRGGWRGGWSPQVLFLQLQIWSRCNEFRRSNKVPNSGPDPKSDQSAKGSQKKVPILPPSPKFQYNFNKWEKLQVYNPHVSLDALKRKSLTWDGLGYPLASSIWSNILSKCSSI